MILEQANFAEPPQQFLEFTPGERPRAAVTGLAVGIADHHEEATPLGNPIPTHAEDDLRVIPGTQGFQDHDRPVGPRSREELGGRENLQGANFPLECGPPPCRVGRHKRGGSPTVLADTAGKGPAGAGKQIRRNPWGTGIQSGDFGWNKGGLRGLTSSEAFQSHKAHRKAPPLPDSGRTRMRSQPPNAPGTSVLTALSLRLLAKDNQNIRIFKIFCVFF